MVSIPAMVIWKETCMSSWLFPVCLIIHHATIGRPPESEICSDDGICNKADT